MAPAQNDRWNYCVVESGSSLFESPLDVMSRDELIRVKSESRSVDVCVNKLVVVIMNSVGARKVAGKRRPIHVYVTDLIKTVN